MAPNVLASDQLVGILQKRPVGREEYVGVLLLELASACFGFSLVERFRLSVPCTFMGVLKAAAVLAARFAAGVLETDSLCFFGFGV